MNAYESNHDQAPGWPCLPSRTGRSGRDPSPFPGTGSSRRVPPPPTPPAPPMSTRPLTPPHARDATRSSPLARWLQHGFFTTALWILLASGALKLVGSLLGHPVLDAPDPLFPWITRRFLAAGTGLFEIAVAVLLRPPALPARRWFLVSWITSIFLAYRLGLWIVGYQGLCPCLGTTLDQWTGSALAEDRLAHGLFLYLLVGCLATGWWHYRRPPFRVRPSSPQACLLGASLTLSLLTPTHAAPAGLVLEGDLRWYCPPNTASDLPCVTWAYRVTLAGESWSVRTTVVEGEDPGRNAFAYGEPGMLVNLMQGGSSTPPHRQQAQEDLLAILRTKVTPSAALATNEAVDSVALILNGTAPPYQPNGIPTVWLALCSPPHLDARDSARLHPMFDMGAYQRPRFPINARITYLDRARRLPATIVFWNEGKIEDFDGPLAEGLPPFRPAPGPYATGFTNALYAVSARTNVGGHSFPLRFQHWRLEPRPDGTRPDQLEVVWRYEGRVTSITPVASDLSHQPDFPVRLTAVMDQRIQKDYPDIQDARYQATNAAWMQPDRLANLPNVFERTQRIERHRQWSPLGWLLVLLAVAGFPAWAAWRSGRFSNRFSVGKNP